RSFALYVLCGSLILAVVFAVISQSRAELYRHDTLIWEDLVEQNPKSPLIVNNYCLALLRRGANADAIARMERLINDIPNYGPVLLNLSMGYSRIERFPEAEAVLKRLIDANPTEALPLTSLALLYHQRGMT